MDVKIENGAIKYSDSCVPQYIDSLDEIVQRVRIACCMKKGDFALDKNLGCFADDLSINDFDIDDDMNIDDDLKKDKLTMIFKEATLNVPYSDLEVVECRVENSTIVAKIKISCNDKTAYTEVSIDV